MATRTVWGPGIVGRRDLPPEAAQRDAERAALVERFWQDRYLAPLDGEQWRRYGRGAEFGSFSR